MPEAYAPLFAEAVDVLATHRGYDWGVLYRGVSDALVTPLRRRYGGSARWRALVAVLGATLATAVEGD